MTWIQKLIDTTIAQTWIKLCAKTKSAKFKPSVKDVALKEIKTYHQDQRRILALSCHLVESSHVSEFLSPAEHSYIAQNSKLKNRMQEKARYKE